MPWFVSPLTGEGMCPLGSFLSVSRATARRQKNPKRKDNPNVGNAHRSEHPVTVVLSDAIALDRASRLPAVVVSPSRQCPTLSKPLEQEIHHEFEISPDWVWETRRCRGSSACSGRSSARSISCGWIWRPAVDHHRVGGRGNGRWGDECRYCGRSRFGLGNGPLQRRCHGGTFRDQSRFPVPRDKYLDGSALSRSGKQQSSHRSSTTNPPGNVGDVDVIDHRQQQLWPFQPLSKSDCRLR